MQARARRVTGEIRVSQRWPSATPPRGAVDIVAIVSEWNDIAHGVAAARHLPPAEESYLETDFIMNLLETVLDYQMHTTAVGCPRTLPRSSLGRGPHPR